VVLAVVQQNGKALEYASEELRGDREVVLAAVQQHWGALEYASEGLKGDREVVLAARNESEVFQHTDASEEREREREREGY
jgi:hypothetical protein